MDVTCHICGSSVPAKSTCEQCGSWLPAVDAPESVTPEDQESGLVDPDDLVTVDDPFEDKGAIAALAPPPNAEVIRRPAPQAAVASDPPVHASAPGATSHVHAEQGAGHWRLVLTAPVRELAVLPGAGILLGRESPSPIWDHPSVDIHVSASHARVWADGDELLIKDCGSTNGTWVGVVRLEPFVPYPLRPGDVIQLTQHHPVRLEVKR